MTFHPQIYRYGAQELAGLIQAVEQNVHQPQESPSAAPRYQLNIVAGDDAQLTVKRKLVAHALAQTGNTWQLQNQHVFLAEKGQWRDAHLALLFPGQGSHYRGMCSELIADRASRSQVLERVNDGLCSIDVEPLPQLVADANEQLERDLTHSQAAILGCEILGLEAVRQAGWQADIYLGHSFGEYAALYAAGCWDESQVLHASAARARAIARSGGPPSRLLVAFCSDGTAREICSAYPQSAYVANWNSPTQTVLGVTTTCYQQLLEDFERQQIRTRELAVFHAFHTPLMQAAAEECREEWRGLALKAPRFPLLSSVSEQIESDPERLRENLIDQFVTPLRWPFLLRQLHDQRVRCFLEVGAGQTLTGLNRNTFQAADNVLCVSLDDPKLGARHQAIVVQAAHEIWNHGRLQVPAPTAIRTHSDQAFGAAWLDRLHAKSQATGKTPEALAQEAAAADCRIGENRQHCVVTTCTETGVLQRELRCRGSRIAGPERSSPAVVSVNSQWHAEVIEDAAAVGGLAGRNACGLCVSAIQLDHEEGRAGPSELSADPATQEHSLGVTMSMVITEVLTTASTVVEAAERFAQAPVTGRWSVLLLDSNTTSSTGAVADLKTVNSNPSGLHLLVSPEQVRCETFTDCWFAAGVERTQVTNELASAATSEAFWEASLSSSGIKLTVPRGEVVAVAPDCDQICTRLVPQLIAAPMRASDMDLRSGGAGNALSASRFATGTTVVLGGTAAVVTAITTEIRRVGGTVVAIHDWHDRADLLARMQAAAARHVVLFAGFDGNADPQDEAVFDDAGLERYVMTPYLALQAWYASLEEPGPDRQMLLATFVIASRWGGDLGWDGATAGHLAGAWTGLSKAMFLERAIANSRDQRVGDTDLRTLAIDFDTVATETFVAEKIVTEVATKRREAEVAYREGTRYIVRSSPQPLPLEPNPPNSLPLFQPNAGCWIVTGGARGVTAEIVCEMIRRLGAEIHLVGSSPLPAIDTSWLDYSPEQLRALRTEIVRQAVERKVLPADEWARVEKAIEIARNLRRFAALRGHVHYHACDISQRAAVEKLTSSIRSLGKPIIGIVHGAGFEKASRFAGKKEQLVRQTFAVKALGAWNLMAVTAADPIQTFIGFGSISGRYGSIGQTDYSAANEWLAKLIARYRRIRPGVHAVSMDWHSWDEVGMAARPESKQALTRKAVTYMPVAEGVRHFLAELCGRCRDPEVVITDLNYHKKHFPDEKKGGWLQPNWCLAPLACCNADLGPIVIVGNNPLALELFAQSRKVSSSCYLVASPQSQDAAEQLQSLLTTIGCRQLVWLVGNDPEAMIGRGWERHRQRIEVGYKLSVQVIQAWLRGHAERALATSPASPLLLFGRQIETVQEPKQQATVSPIAPELWWPIWFCEAHQAALKNRTPSGPEPRLRCVEVDGSWSASSAAQTLLLELQSVDGSAHVRYSALGRYAKQWTAAEFSSTSAATDRAGIAVVQPRGAGRPSDEKSASMWLVVGARQAANQPEFEALSGLRPPAFRSVDAAGLNDITTCVQTLSAERAAARDRLTGLVVMETVNSLQEAHGIHSLQRLAALLEATRPDRLERIMLLTPPLEPAIAATVGGLSGWLHWFARRHPATRICLLAGAVDNQGQLRAGAGPQLVSWFEARDHGEGRVDELLCDGGESNTQEAASGAGIVDSQKSLALAPQTERMVTASNSTLSQETIAGTTRAVADPGTDVIALSRIHLDPVRDPFLAEHRFRQRPLLPLVGMIECFLESAVDSGRMSRDLPYTISDLRIGHGLKFLNDDAKTVEVRWRQTASGLVGELTTEFRDSKGRLLDARRNIASVTLGGPPATPALVRDLGIESDAPWRTFVYPDADSIIFHGSTYRWVELVQPRGEQMLAHVVGRCPNEIGGGRRGDWLIPLALADVGLYVCGSMWYSQNPSSVTIPQGVDRWSMFQPAVAGKIYRTLVGYRNRSATGVVFDSVIVDEQGKPVLAIEGYRAALVATGKGE
jgi:malonyl CoA-acyl carrier protein transacylase